jgi:hypothetical protein
LEGSVEDSLTSLVSCGYFFTTGQYMFLPPDPKSPTIGKSHGLINYKGTKTKCCLLFNRVYSQSFWYFRPSFVNYCPNLSLVHLPTPVSPFLKVTYRMYGTEDNAGRGRGGVELCWRPLTRFRTYKIALPPQKNLGGEGASEK